MYRLHNMKQLPIVNITLGVIAFLLASCTDETMLNSSDGDQELQTYTLYLDADVPSFESVHEGETRASGNSWEDGDVIYVTFSNGGSKVVSSATYNSNLEAFEFTATSLNTMSNAKCCVYYLRGGRQQEEWDNRISINQFTAIFNDSTAIYSCSNNVVELSAKLKPYTWRLCFKGEAGTRLKLTMTSGIRYYSSLDLTSGDFSYKYDGQEYFMVNPDGFTPFIYGLYHASSISLQIEVEGISYSRSIDPFELIAGESGYLDIPTPSNLHNWTKTPSTFVDLGLPSGTLWATCNIGAYSPEETGGCYAWGEWIERDDYYDWSNYIYCDGSEETCYEIGDDIAGTDFDAAHVIWGGSWQMPSLAQIEELIKYSTSTRTTMNAKQGTLITGANGTSIFLPTANNGGSDGDSNYWSSSALGSSAYYLHSYYGNISRGWAGRYNGFCVRAICNPSPSFILSQHIANLIVGNSTIVEITYGSGNYSISNYYTDYINASLSGSKITIEALHAGSATIIIDDLGLNQQAKILIKAIGDANPKYPVAEAIDLGLPSGTKWASWNIGASAPEESGGYYAWGEIEEKESYSWYTYLCCENIDAHSYNIGDDISGTEYDVAHMKWGGSWKMPSREQIKELVKYCTTYGDNLNGVDGIFATGPNGATIFLPFAGYKRGTTLFNSERDHVCHYWSSTNYVDDYDYTYGLTSSNTGLSSALNYPYQGLSVRAVCP